MTDTTPDSDAPAAPARTPEKPPRKVGRISDRTVLVILAVSFLVIAGLVGVVVWAVGGSGSASAPRPSFDRYQDAWESAMAKASVEATFPTEPVDLADVRAVGTQPLDATFTAEEMSALMSVYRFEMTVEGETVSTGDVELAFPADGIAEMNAVLFARGSRYRAQASAPLAFENGEITSPGLTSLRVAGFNVGGTNRERASEGIMLYLNRYLGAAPGLRVDEARVLEGGIEVKGAVPERLEYP